MGNKVYIVKSADNGLLNQNQSLEEQLDSMGSQSFQHIDLIHLYKFKREFTKYPTIFEKQHANTATDDEGPLLNLHEELKLLKHPNLVKYYGLCIDPNLTTNVQMSKWYYEAVFKTLKQVCGYHYSNKSLIPERELWKILHQILQALHFLEVRSKWHTHLQPDSIYLDQNGQVKIIPKGVLRYMSGYEIVINKGQALLSPQLIQELHQKHREPINYDLTKSDIYSLGMTYLELLTLKDSFECYNFDLNNPSIKEDLIQQRLEEAEHNGYSNDLIQIVKLMLQEDEYLRPTFLELLNSNEMNQNIGNSRNIQTIQPTTHKVQHSDQSLQPSIPATFQTFQAPIDVSPIKIESQSIPPQYLPQVEKDTLKQEQILREQQIQQQLQLQLRQQYQLLIQQQEQYRQQQQQIEQQQQQIFFFQQQLQQLQRELPYIQKQEPKPAPKQQDYMIHPLPIPPLTLEQPSRNNTIEDFKESQDLSNRINQALALSRQAINKYK